MNAAQYLNEALGGNMNVGTLKTLAWHEIMEGYAQQKLAEEKLTSANNGKVIICPSCEGDGEYRLNGEPYPCTTCLGSGKLQTVA